MNATHLQPLSHDRARQIAEMFHGVQDDPGHGIALDEQGRVTGVVPVNDPRAEHVLGDLDVHA